MESVQSRIRFKATAKCEIRRQFLIALGLKSAFTEEKQSITVLPYCAMSSPEDFCEAHALKFQIENAWKRCVTMNFLLSFKLMMKITLHMKSEHFCL